MPADEADALLLAQTHFAEAIHHVRLHRQLLDANHRARRHGRERTGRRLGATVVAWHVQVGFDSRRASRHAVAKCIAEKKWSSSCRPTTRRGRCARLTMKCAS